MIALALAALLAAAPLAAQAPQVVAAGRVVRVAASDSSAVARATVVLHRIGRDRQGPLDSTTTDGRGRFRLAFPADTTAIFLLTTRHHGIEYFSEPVHTNPARPDTALLLAVYDTSATATIELLARHIIVSAPAEDGTRNVVELLALRNSGSATRVGRDSTTPSWRWRIAPGAVAFSASDGALSAGAIERSGDTALVFAPLPPGDRQVTVEYLMGADIDSVAFPFDDAAPLVNFLVEDESAIVAAPGLVEGDSSVVIQGRRFRRWSGAVAEGARLSVALPGGGGRPGDALRFLVGALALALAAGLVLAFRRSRLRAEVPVPASPDPAALIEAIARLDAEHRQVADRTPDAEAAYAARRAALKTALEAALARPSRHP